MIIKMVLTPLSWPFDISRIKILKGASDVSSSGTLTSNRNPTTGSTATLTGTSYDICRYDEQNEPLEFVWGAPSIANGDYTIEFACPYGHSSLRLYQSFGSGGFSAFGYVRFVSSNGIMPPYYFALLKKPEYYIFNQNLVPEHLQFAQSKVINHRGTSRNSSSGRAGGEYMLFGDAYIKENMTPIERVVKIFDEPDGRCVWMGVTDKFGKFTAWNLSDSPKTAICYEHTGEFRSLVFDNVIPRKMTDAELRENQFKTYNF